MASMILTACGSSLLTEDGRKMNKEEKEALVTKTVREMLANKHYRIEVDKIMSQSARESISHEYSLEIKGDTVVSGLPFMGVCSFFFGRVCQYDLNEVRGFASDIRWAFLCVPAFLCNKPLRPKTSDRWSRGAFGEG